MGTGGSYRVFLKLDQHRPGTECACRTWGYILLLTRQRHCRPVGQPFTQYSLCLQECQEFVSKGIAGTGVGFDAPSVGKLGGRGPVAIHNPGSDQLRDVMLKVSSAVHLFVWSGPGPANCATSCSRRALQLTSFC